MQSTTERPADSAGGTDIGLAIQQQERKTALHDLARLRKEATAEIHRLITFLDLFDPYGSELEEAVDDVACDEDELDDDPSDLEPSLGSIAASENASQGEWARGWTNDLEDEHDGAEPDDEDDPAESGIADHDGLMEQRGDLYCHGQRVE